MEDEKTPPPLPEAVQWYVLDAFGDEDGTGIGRDLLLSLARRVAYARFVHPEFGGAETVLSEAMELKDAAGNGRREREEALDVAATCVRLLNGEK